MKIKIKGFKSLIKAVRNRAHLVPVMTLINGKFKTYYSKRYVSPGEAMETAKEEFKINPYQEAIFESKDGKVKNLTEKDVLKMYDEAGKPGVLQDFIKKNFKRPKVKASTKDNRQLSFDNMMQGGNKKSKNEEKIDKYLSYYKKENHELDVENLNPIQSGDKQKKEIANKERLSLAFKYNNEIGYMRNNVDSSTNTESLKNDYNRHSKLEEIFNNRNDADYWMGTRDSVHELADLIEYDAEYNKKEQKPENGITITGPIYDDDERPTYYINDNGNVIETQDPKVVEQYRQKQKEFKNQAGTDDKNNNPNNDNNAPSPYGQLSKYQFRRLQQKGAALWDKNGEKRLYFNDLGLELAEKIANETNASSARKRAIYKGAEKLYYDIKDERFYCSAGKNHIEEAHLIFKEAKKLLEQLREEETTNPKDIDRLTDNPNLTAEQERWLLSHLGVFPKPNDKYKGTIIWPDKSKLEDLIGKKYNKIGDETYSKAATSRINETLYNLKYDVNKNKVIGDTKDREGIRDMVQKAIDDLIEYIKTRVPDEPEKPEEPEKPQRTEEPEKEIEKLAFRSVGLSGGLIRYNALRKGTTKIESKNEYKQVKNINELVKQVKPIKEAHANIKGRAIMDMFGISADLYTKANNIPFPIGPGAAGYCTRQYNKKTGGAHIVEIGLVADRNNPAAETKTAIHECMHAKIGMSGKNKLIEAQFSGSLKGEHLQLKIEEPMVELSGQAVARQIHGEEMNKSLHSYATFIADFLPRVWTSDIFKNVRKQGSLGIGQEIAKQLTNGNTDFINKVYDSFNANDDKKANSNRMKAIETKVLERTDKVEKIQNDTGVSEIANLVEELKRGTISLEGALNSSKYRELAAVLITKFLEDEDMEALEQLALSF